MSRPLVSILIALAGCAMGLHPVEGTSWRGLIAFLGALPEAP